MEKFLKMGCDTTQVTKTGKTLVMLLMESEQSLEDKKAALEILSRYGLDLSVKDKK